MTPTNEIIGWRFDAMFEPARAIMAEGARVGITACKVCGSAVFLDPTDSVDRPRQHAEFFHSDKLDYQP